MAIWEAVGLRKRGDVTMMPLDLLKEHRRKLINPNNMMVVPLAYAGIRECRAFRDAFRARSEEA